MPDGYQIYNQDAIYFLTFQVVGWADIFSRKIYKDIIVDSLDYCRKNKGLEVFAYVIMTNHVHIVLRSKIGKLSDTIRDLKRHTSKTILKTLDEIAESRKEWLNLVFTYYAKYNKRANKRQVWTHENHAVELTDNNMIDSRIEYIHQNPQLLGYCITIQMFLRATHYSPFSNFFIGQQ
jgi:REP element-mobilizing transposase RayT